MASVRVVAPEVAGTAMAETVAAETDEVALGAAPHRL